MIDKVESLKLKSVLSNNTLHWYSLGIYFTLFFIPLVLRSASYPIRIGDFEFLGIIGLVSIIMVCFSWAEVGRKSF